MKLPMILPLALLCLTGCDPATKPLTQAQADGLVLEIMAANLNASQTNWTITVTPRTNQTNLCNPTKPE